jgi:hypothetical protein
VPGGQNIFSVERRRNMTASFTCTVLVFFLMFIGVGTDTATAAPRDLVGKWGGTASIATDEGFSTSSVSLDIVEQQGPVFSGTMQFGDETPFNVNGVVDKKVIHITGSASVFEAIISGQGGGKRIHGTGSRLETATFPSATTVFDLHKENVKRSCRHSGGTVEAGLCCASVGDFPNTCSIGSCGCSPSSSREVKICDCGPNSCFDGNKCVSR